MPLYEYACDACGRRFERLVRTFREEVACPACGSAAVEKLLSTFAMAGVGGGAEPASGGPTGGCCGGGCGCAH
jgi:putative FmdB family regulatory protein